MARSKKSVPPPPLSTSTSTPAPVDTEALSSIEAVTDAEGQFVDSALGRSTVPSNNNSNSNNNSGDRSVTIPGEESIITASRTSGLDFGSIKQRIAGAIDHAVHPKDGSETSISKRQ